MTREDTRSRAYDLYWRLGRGINFGNALDAPDAPRLRLEEHHFDVVKHAGFDSVRLPVQWSARADPDPPYTIAPAFFDQVDRAVDNALARDLNIVLNIHHFNELCDDPDGQSARFVGIWRQIAARYAAYPDRLYFELLNEPRAPMTAECWNGLLAEALDVIRESNPDRMVIVGSAEANDIDALARLSLPATDDRLIVTAHYYRPFAFTHQGAGWVSGSEPWLGTTWGSADDQDAVRADLARAADWSREHLRPLFVGEFGAYERADSCSRMGWTAFVRSELERHGITWAYWEFGTDFGAFDLERDEWRDPFLHAFFPDR